MIGFISRFLAFLVSCVPTWLQFTSVANRHRRRSIYSCVRRSSRPYLHHSADIGLFPVYFRLLALPATMVAGFRYFGLLVMSGTGMLSARRSRLWHRYDERSPVAVMAPMCWVKHSRSAAMDSMLGTIIILFSKLEKKSGEVTVSILRAGAICQLNYDARAGHYSIQNLSFS